ncbi:hypothetical protein TRVL_01499 [Trypanosoma vivax]|uniref:Uncharacterized protein n=1 Tax=Trypanosoma vivax (strain Y486) TaxID=1055687 RepID=F9WLA0_TRYVY|nr:hypothetical protein TRVL_01499 [Trypanosoma vivax]CCD18288.1 hypothetical protein TvY486_0009640 [Trypanosoma vivax Y486]|eukprot:CCD18288.1 hypothetical protein TvY486_0009640 [Trypanosoma vivax Y486]
MLGTMCGDLFRSREITAEHVRHGAGCLSFERGDVFRVGSESLLNLQPSPLARPAANCLEWHAALREQSAIELQLSLDPLGSLASTKHLPLLEENAFQTPLSAPKPDSFIPISENSRGTSTQAHERT